MRKLNWIQYNIYLNCPNSPKVGTVSENLNSSIEIRNIHPERNTSLMISFCVIKREGAHE